jgi:hypothetical protein
MLKLLTLLFCFSTISYADHSYADQNINQDTPNNWSSLPVEQFRPLIADVRESQFSIQRGIHNSSENRFNAGIVSFGDYLALTDYQLDKDRALQFSIDGSLYALFDLDKPSYNLLNLDFIFGLSLSYSDNSFSSRFRIYHSSSHLGDEFLLENPGFDRSNSSFEDTELLLAYQIENWRLYGGGGSIFRSNSLDKLEPLHFQIGTEYRRPLTNFYDFLVAADFEIAQRTDWTIARSVLAGIVILKNETKEVRLMANYYNGNSPFGQFFKDRLVYYGLGIYFIV